MRGNGNTLNSDSALKSFLSKRAFNKGITFHGEYRRMNYPHGSLFQLAKNQPLGAIQPSISGGVKGREGENRNGSHRAE